MEPEDTVLRTRDELKPYRFHGNKDLGDMKITEEQWDIPKLLKAQAKVSFKAGIREGEQRFAEKISFNRTMDMMLKKKEGMEKVVEELRLRGDMSMNFPFSNIRKEAWQDILKDLDIEKGGN